MRSAVFTAKRSSLATVLLLVACVWLPNSAVHVPTTKANTMSDVVIATFPIEPAVLSGARLDVRTVFDNRGAGAASVPNRFEASPLRYILRSQAPGGRVYDDLSQESTDARRSPDRYSPPPPQTEMLGAGKKLEFFEDVAQFWNEGFEPGEYWLTVRYDAAGLESPKSAVTILPLVVESLSSDVTVDHLSSFVAHRAQDGTISLLQRESEVRDPREGDFTTRETLPGGSAVSVATSVDVTLAGNGRWLAWLRDGKLAAINAWGTAITKRAEPLDAHGALLSPGFQIGVGKAVFGTVTREGRLETYLASAAGLAKGWSADLGSATERARWNAQPDGSVTVVWEETASGRVMVRSFDAAGSPRDAAPRAITPGRPATWGLPPTGAATPWVLVLDGGTPVIATFPPGGERQVTRLPALPDARAWQFLQTQRDTGVVVALSGSTVRSTRLGSTEWNVIADAPGSSGLHLVSLDGRSIWTEWIEEGRGIRLARVPR